MFSAVIGPGLARLSAPSRGEFFVKVAPNYVKFVEIFSGLTLVFGVAMVAVLSSGGGDIMSPSTSTGLYITVGAVLALVAIILAYTLIIPSAKKMVKIAEAMMKAPGPPPPELGIAARRLRMGTVTATVLLLVVTALMVAAATV